MTYLCTELPKSFVNLHGYGGVVIDSRYLGDVIMRNVLLIPTIRCPANPKPARVLLTIFATTLAWLLFGPGSAQAQVEWPDNLNEPPRATEPTTVAMSLYLDDVNRIDVATNSFEVTGQLVMAWHDERLTTLFAADNARSALEFEGDAVADVLAQLWHPAVEIMNERGQRNTGVRALDIHPDGRVKLYEKFDSLAHLEGDMHLFPFVQVNLRLAFNAFVQNQSELLLLAERVEFQHGASADAVITGPWSFVALTMVEGATYRSDEPHLLYPRVDFVLTVQRNLGSGLSIFLLPVLLIWICAFSLLWLDAAQFNSYGSPRIGGMLTLLLTTVALQLTWEARLPSVHYLTLPNVLIYVTILLLTLSISLSVLYIHVYHNRSKEQARTFDRLARWAYPALALLAVIGAVLILVLQTR